MRSVLLFRKPSRDALMAKQGYEKKLKHGNPIRAKNGGLNPNNYYVYIRKGRPIGRRVNLFNSDGAWKP